jgi:hypothetical protein
MHSTQYQEKPTSANEQTTGLDAGNACRGKKKAAIEDDGWAGEPIPWAESAPQ